MPAIPWCSLPIPFCAALAGGCRHVQARQRYWLGLDCTSGAAGSGGTCGVGVRMHSKLDPLPMSMAGRTLTSRLIDTALQCEEITDKEKCCASINRASDGHMFQTEHSRAPCIAAVGTFSNGKVCMPSDWVARFGVYDQATCPARPDPRTRLASPRVTLPHDVGCHFIRDRAECCSAIDGRTEGLYMHQPCIPAQKAYRNGNVCEAAVRAAGREMNLAHCFHRHAARRHGSNLPLRASLDLAPCALRLDLARLGSTWLDLARFGSTWLDLA